MTPCPLCVYVVLCWLHRFTWLIYLCFPTRWQDFDCNCVIFIKIVASWIKDTDCLNCVTPNQNRWNHNYRYNLLSYSIAFGKGWVPSLCCEIFVEGFSSCIYVHMFIVYNSLKRTNLMILIYVKDIYSTISWPITVILIILCFCSMVKLVDYVMCIMVIIGSMGLKVQTSIFK